VKVRELEAITLQIEHPSVERCLDISNDGVMSAADLGILQRRALNLGDKSS
jgi:hypothetical protein